MSKANDKDKDPDREPTPSEAAAKAVGDVQARKSLSPTGWVTLLIGFVLLVVLAFA